MEVCIIRKVYRLFSSKLFEAGCGKYFKLKIDLDLREIYRQHFRMNDVKKLLDAN